jgi:hypothetical protein
MARNFKELRRSVLIGAYPPLPAFYSEEINLLIKALLQMNPKDRPTADELLLNPYLNKKGRRVLEAKLERTAEEPRRILMRTIKMKDLASLKQVLPAPNYRPDDAKGKSAESSGRLLLNEKYRSEKEDIGVYKSRQMIKNGPNPGIVSADNSIIERRGREDSSKSKIQPSRNHFSIKVKSHQVSVNNSLAEEADSYTKREKMPDIRELRHPEAMKSIRDALKSRRALEAPIKQTVSLEMAAPSLSRPTSRNSNQQGFLPKFPRKIIMSNLLSQKKSNDFRLDRERDDDIIDQMLSKKDSSRIKKGIWATDDPRESKHFDEEQDSRLDIQVNRVRLSESPQEVFSRRKNRNIS